MTKFSNYIQPDLLQEFKSFLTELITPIVTEAVKSVISEKENTKTDARYITIKKAREIYSLTPSSIYRKFDQGKLTKYKSGGRTLLDPLEIERIITKKPYCTIAPYRHGMVNKKETYRK